MTTTAIVSSNLTSQAASTAGTTSTLTSLTANDFLTLLLTQLQNQDPMDPASTSDMSSLFGTLTQVSQSADTNTYLAQVVDSMAAINNNNAVSYLGKTITYLDATSTEVSEKVTGISFKNSVTCLQTAGGNSVDIGQVTGVS